MEIPKRFFLKNEGKNKCEELLPLNFCLYQHNILGGSSLVDNRQFRMLKEQFGISHIISLTSYSLSDPKFCNGVECFTPEPNLLDGVDALGITIHHFPIKDGGVPKTSQIVELVKLFKQTLSQGKVYVHCWRGNGRTRTVIGAYLKLVEKEEDVFPILEKINEGKNEYDPKEKLSQEQITFLQNLNIVYVINTFPSVEINTEGNTVKVNTTIQGALRTVFSSDRSRLIIGSFSDLFPSIHYNFDAAVRDLELAKNPPVFLYNKLCYQHRDVGFFSDESKGYHYSNQLMPSQPLTHLLKELLELVNQKFNPLGGRKYNGILINRYMDGSNNINAHSDDERDLGENGVVAISLGATRKFRIRNKHPFQVSYEHWNNGMFQAQFRPDKSKEIMFELPLIDKSVVWMEGDFQKEFTHEIPVEKKVKETRISLTFRSHLF